MIRRARRDGREARGNEEREKREDEKGRRERMRKGAIVSSSPQGITSWSSSINICFFLAYRMHFIKMSWCETKCKKTCAIGEQNVIN